MYARVINAVVRPGKMGELLNLVNEKVLPMLEESPSTHNYRVVAGP